MAETLEYKAKRKLYSKVLKTYQLWTSLRESSGVETIEIVHEGIQYEFHYMDILKGLSVLPPRQREAVWLMCVEDMPEAEVADIMGFDSTRATPIQQYKNFGLARFIEFNESDPEEKAALIDRAKRWNEKD